MKIDYKNKKVLDENSLTDEELQLKLEKSKLVLQADVIATKESLATAKINLAAAKTAYPLDVSNIIKHKSEVDKYTKGIEYLQELQKELGLRDEDLVSIVDDIIDID